MDPYASNFNPSSSYSGYYEDVNASYDSTQMGGVGGADSVSGYSSFYPSNDLENSNISPEGAVPGSYYPTSPPIQVAEAAVNAIALDTTYDVVYSATVTTAGAKNSSNNITHNAASGGDHRVSYLSTHSLKSNNGILLYARTAGHPEASPTHLHALYTSLFGTSPPSRGRGGNPTLYRPPFGLADPALPDRAVVGSLHTGNSSYLSTSNHQMGITKLMTLPSQQQQHVASVSPAAVRVHTMGGVCVADYYEDGTYYTAGDTITSTMIVAATSHNTLQTLDIWQGLRPISSSTVPTAKSTTTSTASSDSVLTTAITTTSSHSSYNSSSNNNSMVMVGRSNGDLLLYDVRCRHRIAHMATPHGGQGVVAVAASSTGSLMATTGYSTLPSCPDPSIAVYDSRYLGRGGFPHAFTGLRGGPRHIAFIAGDRLLVASGQVHGGCQLLTPFTAESDDNIMNQFLVPPLENGEAMTAMAAQDDMLVFGTSLGRMLPYQMAEYEKYMTRASHSSSEEGRSRGGRGIFVPPSSRATPTRRPIPAAVEKKSLTIPPFEPTPPALSIDASILLKEGNSMRGGTSAHLRSIFGSYILAADPVVSSLGNVHGDKTMSSFGILATTPLVEQTKLQVKPDLMSTARHPADFSLSAASLGVNLLEDGRTKKQAPKSSNKKTSIPNPNKLIYSNSLNKLVYTESLNRMKRLGRRSKRSRAGSEESTGDTQVLPTRYRLFLRPTHKLAASFPHEEFNHTGLFPGYDYAITMPNAFVPPVLMMLFFVPEIHDAALRHQRTDAALHQVNDGKGTSLLLTELGFLFHRIESLARRALLFPADEGVNAMSALTAWAPSSFISCLMSTPEAERFQILDGSPAAIEPSRRPEAFYRFLMYQLDNEIQRGTRPPVSSSGGGNSTTLIDSLCGTGFISINEFVSGSGPPTKSSTRHLTVELSYDNFYSREYQKLHPEVKPSFGDVLQFNLCRATRLRAWSQTSKSYETIVQRKIVTCLPKVLSLSAACAGRKPENGLSLWRESPQWLPEMLEIEMEETGSVVVREQVRDADGNRAWKECKGSTELPHATAQEVTECTHPSVIRRRRYALDAVVSLVRDDLDRNCPEEVRGFVGEEGCLGHHVLHARVSQATRKKILQHQRTEVKRHLSSESVDGVTDMTLLGLGCTREILQRRLTHVEELLSQLPDDDTSTWILMNGFMVTDATIDDVREFAHDFKEPSLILYRAMEEENEPKIRLEEQFHIPIDVLRTTSLADPRSPPPLLPRTSTLPGAGDLIAFDAEFVAVEEEESMLTPTGSKVVIRETRHVLARISLVDGRNGTVLLDNHVLPQEPVTDYLTRFSGIVAADLDPQRSRHHLISATAAYWKLRYWLETRKCIFVGHGVLQDFWTANLAVSAAQVIDTVHIYHKPAQRFISLRFVTNFVLQRDMQLDTHDSTEDALASLELYRKAIEHKKDGTFERLLSDLYELGQRSDWKLGVGDIMEEKGF